MRKTRRSKTLVYKQKRGLEPLFLRLQLLHEIMQAKKNHAWAWFFQAVGSLQFLRLHELVKAHFGESEPEVLLFTEL